MIMIVIVIINNNNTHNNDTNDDDDDNTSLVADLKWFPTSRVVDLKNWFPFRV